MRFLQLIAAAMLAAVTAQAGMYVGFDRYQGTGTATQTIETDYGSTDYDSDFETGYNAFKLGFTGKDKNGRGEIALLLGVEDTFDDEEWLFEPGSGVEGSWVYAFGKSAVKPAIRLGGGFIFHAIKDEYKYMFVDEDALMSTFHLKAGVGLLIGLGNHIELSVAYDYLYKAWAPIEFYSNDGTALMTADTSATGGLMSVGINIHF